MQFAYFCVTALGQAMLHLLALHAAFKLQTPPTLAFSLGYCAQRQPHEQVCIIHCAAHLCSCILAKRSFRSCFKLIVTMIQRLTSMY